MKIKSQRFGEVEVEEKNVIRFPAGVLGFPAFHDWVLLQSGDVDKFLWLQSIEKPEMAFVVTDPKFFFADYHFLMRDDTKREIGITPTTPLNILVIVNKVDDMLTANLQGPLVFNRDNNQAMQVVVAERIYQTRHPIAFIPPRKRAEALAAER